MRNLKDRMVDNKPKSNSVPLMQCVAARTMSTWLKINLSIHFGIWSIALHCDGRFLSSLSRTCVVCQSWNGRLRHWRTLQAFNQHLLPPYGYSLQRTPNIATIPFQAHHDSGFVGLWINLVLHLNHFVLNSLLGESYELERWNKEEFIQYSE